MTDPLRVQHRYDESGEYCTRCFCARQAVADGFVNVLCKGEPITHRIRSNALEDAREVFTAIVGNRKFTEAQHLLAFEAFVRAIINDEVRG